MKLICSVVSILLTYFCITIEMNSCNLLYKYGNMQIKSFRCNDSLVRAGSNIGPNVIIKLNKCQQMYYLISIR